MQLTRTDLSEALAAKIDVDFACLQHRARNNDKGYWENKKELVLEVLAYIWLPERFETADFQHCDFRNDKNEEGHYYCDLASERADSQVDIYHGQLRKAAYAFADFTEEALQEGLVDVAKPDMPRILQAGQYQFYNQTANEILAALNAYFQAN